MFASRLIELFFSAKHQLASDEKLAVAVLHQRDRQLALGHNMEMSSPSVSGQLLCLKRWVLSLQPQLVERLRLSSFISSLFILLVALFCGCVYATTTLSYDGTRPLNLLLVFVLLVVVPSFLSFLSFYPLLAVYLPWLPGNRLLAYLYEKVNLSVFFKGIPSPRIAEGPSKLWFLSQLSIRSRQLLAISLTNLFALFFCLGILASLFFLAATSDLAFSWSSSLESNTEALTDVVALLSAPWATFFPAAVPGADVVEASRYFRLEKLDSLAQHSVVLGGWWKFLFLSICTYALLPRALSYFLSTLFLKRELVFSLLGTFGVRAIFERMASPYVELSESRAEFSEVAPVSSGEDALKSLLPLRFRSKVCVIVWADQAFDEEAFVQASRAEASGSEFVFYYLGGLKSSEEDSDIIKRIYKEASGKTVIFLARSWEAPSGDLLAILLRLAKVIGVAELIQLGLIPLGYPMSKEYRISDIQAWIHGMKQVSAHSIVLSRLV